MVYYAKGVVFNNPKKGFRFIKNLLRYKMQKHIKGFFKSIPPTKCIYMITDPLGYKYIGQTKNLFLRIKAHHKTRTRSPILISFSIVKHGIQNCKIEILEEIVNNDFTSREVFWIEHHKTCVNKYPNGMGLNRNSGGAGQYETTDEHRELQRRIKIANPISDEIKMRLRSEYSNLILNLENGIFYEGISEVCNTYPIKKTTLHRSLTNSPRTKIRYNSFVIV